MADRQDLNLEQAAFIFNLQHVADMDFAGGFGAQVSALNAADIAGFAGKGTRLEKTCGPQPLVDADS
jgi:hypothetical protein